MSNLIPAYTCLGNRSLSVTQMRLLDCDGFVSIKRVIKKRNEIILRNNIHVHFCETILGLGADSSMKSHRSEGITDPPWLTYFHLWGSTLTFFLVCLLLFGFYFWCLAACQWDLEGKKKAAIIDFL